MRWRILAILFFARTAMAVQYQAIAALSPFVENGFEVGLADVGWLIGLYFAPGILVALPGGALAQWIGDRRIVSIGLALMTAGGLAMALSPDWGVHVAGRVVAGIGGVILNVVMTKMLADWFEGRELGTAMALFINSWPFGIALALVALPRIATAASYGAALSVVAGLCAAGFVAVAAGYRRPAAQPGKETAAANGAAWPQGRMLVLVILAGAVWGFFNAALAAVFGFGPAALVEIGWTLASATTQVSLVLWALAGTAVFGGILMDRTGRPVAVIASGLALFALALLWVWSAPGGWLGYALIGAACGLSAGPIMTLPAAVLSGPVRALGMGLFFTLYYVAMVIGPAFAGWFAQRSASGLMAYPAALVLLAVTAASLLAFQWLRRAAARAEG